MKRRPAGLIQTLFNSNQKKKKQTAKKKAGKKIQKAANEIL